MLILVLQILKSSRSRWNVKNRASLKELSTFVTRRYISAMAEAIDKKRLVLRGLDDRYNGITVSSELEQCNNEEFLLKLEESLKQWADKNKRGVWFKVFHDQSYWIPHLSTNGFKYHHAKEDYVMMYKWLPKDEKCNIPPYAHTSIGVGSIVVNDKNQVLVVKEKYFFDVPHWKLPGGYLEPGEDLVDGAIREVMEETGIQTEFYSMISVRHAHGVPFAFYCSDMYFVVALKALSTDLKRCDREIEECAWMDIDEYLKHPHIHELNRLFVQKYVDYKQNGVIIKCDSGVHPAIKKKYTFYYAVKDKL